MRILPCIVILLILQEGVAQEVEQKDMRASYKVEDGNIYRAIDGDNGWEQTQPLREQVEQLLWNPYQPELVYAVGREALYVSSRGGRVWMLRQLLPANFEPVNLALSIREPNLVVLLGTRTMSDGSSHDVGWCSLNGGMTWESILDMDRAKMFVADSTKLWCGVTNKTTKKVEER